MERIVKLAIAAIGVAVVACAAMAQSPPASRMEYGFRTGVYADSEAGYVGAELLTPIADAWYFNPNVEYARGDRDVLTLNGDFHYDFLRDRSTYFWAGGGPAVLFRETGVDEHRTDLGANVLGGVGWRTGRVTPFLQSKVTLSRDTEAVLTFGLRF